MKRLSHVKAHIRKKRKTGKREFVKAHKRRIHHIRIAHGRPVRTLGTGFVKGLEDIEKGAFSGLREGEEAVIVVGKGVIKGTEDLGHGAVKIVTTAEQTGLDTARDVVGGGIGGAEHLTTGAIKVVGGATSAVADVAEGTSDAAKQTFRKKK
jgi:hypothetical protein